MFSVQVSYKVKKGSAPWVSAATTHLNLKQQSETLIMQALKDKHKGHEIQLVSFKWR